MKLLAISAFLAAACSPALVLGQLQPQMPDPAADAKQLQEMVPDSACQGTCVPPEDMQVFVGLLRERKCLTTEKPEFKLDPIEIVIDDKGRVFYSGADPKPYKLHMKWCNFEVDGQGKVNLVAAMVEPPTWGFRLRPKAYLGYLPLEFVVYGEDAKAGIDAGLLLDFFYFHWVNVNVALGFRSGGLDVGADLTKNFGVATGWALGWDGFRHNANAAIWFAF
jgi:hypothetical protein